VKLITADPKTSGVARWNFLALWGSVLKTGGDETKALDLTTKVYKNVPILTKDAREATDVFFKQGQGDALINYENEIILAGEKGEKPTYTIPKSMFRSTIRLPLWIKTLINTVLAKSPKHLSSFSTPQKLSENLPK
jgi:ABC-type sulfate transport system substrate-binding protein